MCKEVRSIICEVCEMNDDCIAFFIMQIYFKLKVLKIDILLNRMLYTCKSEYDKSK